MTQIASWIAPAATMLAAMMTAANLGARITGWGFVVFTIGSLSWSLIGASSGQSNLLATNAFLTLVNLVGIWRWLGRQRGYEDGGKSAEDASRRVPAVPDLLTATSIAGMSVERADGTTIGRAVEALFECGSACISYVVVARPAGGVSEELRAVPREQLSFACDRLVLKMAHDTFSALPVLADGDWPAAPVRTAPSR